jgi:hypothetical protein
MGRVLCEDGLKVMVGGKADRAMLYVKDGDALRFWCDTFELEMVLLGQPAELHTFGGSCHVEVNGDSGSIVFKSDKAGSHTCNFPRQSLVDAIRGVKEYNAG